MLLDAWTSRRCLALTSERLRWLYFTVNSQSPQCHQVWLLRSVSVKERPRNCLAGVHFRSASQAAWRATLFWIRSCTRFFLASTLDTCTFCRPSSYHARHSRLRVHGKAGNRFLVTLVGRANLGSDLAAQDSARIAFAALPTELGRDQAVHTWPSPSGANVQQS